MVGTKNTRGVISGRCLGAQVRAPTVEEKLCPNCNERKRAPLFYPNTITPDGLSENCRSCCKVRHISLLHFTLLVCKLTSACCEGIGMSINFTRRGRQRAQAW